MNTEFLLREKESTEDNTALEVDNSPQKSKRE
jgi:hypothetical protein